MGGPSGVSSQRLNSMLLDKNYLPNIDTVNQKSSLSYNASSQPTSAEELENQKYCWGIHMLPRPNNVQGLWGGQVLSTLLRHFRFLRVL